MQKLFDHNSSVKSEIQFYLISGAVCTILLPPEYNNPFLLLILVNSLSNIHLLERVKQSFKNIYIILPMFFWLLYALSYFYSEDQITALKEINKLAALGFFPFVLSLGPELKSEHLIRLKWHYVISLTLLSVYSITHSFLQMFNEDGFVFDWLLLSYENLVSGIGAQPLYFSMFIALALFFLFDIQRRYKPNVAHMLLTSYLFIYMMMLSTRMTTLAFFFIFFVYNLLTALKSRNFAYNLFTFSLFLFTAIVIVLFNPVNKKRFEEALNPNSSYETDQYGGRSIRIEKWKCSLEVFADSPIFGVGAGDLKQGLMSCYEKNGVDAALFYEFNSHNQYLNTLGQVGLFGLFLWLVLLILSAKHAYELESDAFIIFLMLFAMCILSESMLGRRWGIFFFVLFYSIFNLFPNKENAPGLISWIKSKLIKK